MFELMQKLVAFKYSCKFNHWKTDNYSMHLLCDRLQEDVDDKLDDIAERYFMAYEKKEEISRELLNPALLERDLKVCVKGIIDHIEKMLADGEWSEGMQSLLSGMAEEFYGKLALVTLK